MLEQDLTLEELSERTGVEARTLRSWVSEGLLSPPLKPGRGARYPGTNVDRALAVRALKDVHGLSLAEIGRRFMMASVEQIRDWAQDAGAARKPRSSARSYLRDLETRSVPPVLPQPSPDFSASEEPPSRKSRMMAGKPSEKYSQMRLERSRAELASIERLIVQLEEVLDAPAPRRARGSIWTRISVTPDLELSVRGDLAPRERALFEQLADQFRAILSGRTKND